MNAPVLAFSLARALYRGLHRRRLHDPHHVGLVLGARDELAHERVLGREQEERAAEQRVGARGEHGDALVGRLAVRVAQREVDLGALAAADPVRLHRLDALGPARQLVEVVEELLRVVGDLEVPLLELALVDLAACSASTRRRR